MDDKLQSSRRKALASYDEVDAIAWFRNASRANDMMQVLESMQHLGEVQHPDLMKQVREIDELTKLIDPSSKGQHVVPTLPYRKQETVFAPLSEWPAGLQPRTVIGCDTLAELHASLAK